MCAALLGGGGGGLGRWRSGGGKKLLKLKPNLEKSDLSESHQNIGTNC